MSSLQPPQGWLVDVISQSYPPMSHTYRDVYADHTAYQPEASRNASRPRVTMACKHCRQRKVRCDGVRPECGLCKRLGKPCNYVKVTAEENSVLRDKKRAAKARKAAQMEAARTAFHQHDTFPAYHPYRAAQAHRPYNYAPRPTFLSPLPSASAAPAAVASQSPSVPVSTYLATSSTTIPASLASSSSDDYRSSYERSWGSTSGGPSSDTYHGRDVSPAEPVPALERAPSSQGSGTAGSPVSVSQQISPSMYSESRFPFGGALNVDHQPANSMDKNISSWSLHNPYLTSNESSKAGYADNVNSLSTSGTVSDNRPDWLPRFPSYHSHYYSQSQQQPQPQYQW
ncbi:hypothetical protein BCV70DRAFT_218365 [Testicularia cyperi]|uniref:Zn(2)-C6 fungal-type domain-containing protein n=1 Tax=Testicularia cyperi TaxID=1882483 RepID=A0A317XNK5_9BASI|nr:hypothetical protein BCV70DRAFT_218365 [Testicularia cyperi]